MGDVRSYLVVDDLVSLDSADQLALLAEGEDRWKLHEEWFFSQNDFAWVRREFGRPHVGDVSLPIGELLAAGKDLFENQFNCVIGNHFTVVGHKMVPGQLVGLHNDSPEQDRGRIENFRLVYYVDRDFQDEKGGHLILFGSRDVSDVLDAVRPIFNSAILMQLSDTSFHAVSRVRRGTRYSIVASYWGYPILFTAPAEQDRVRNLLRCIVDAGFEDMPHSGTTFACHLYQTFRILYGWKQDIDVCLAGLAHSLLGRRSSGVPSSKISSDEVCKIVGGRAYSVIQLLSIQDGFAAALGNESWVSKAAYMVELANLLEQANDEQELAEVVERSCSFPMISSDITGLVAADVARIRAARKLAVPSCG